MRFIRVDHYDYGSRILSFHSLNCYSVFIILLSILIFLSHYHVFLKSQQYMSEIQNGPGMITKHL